MTIPTEAITTGPDMRPRGRTPRILVAGLGNLLLQDDGVGVHAVRELRQAPPSGVLVVEVGTAVLDALHLYEWADKILALDAMQAGGKPGTVYAFGLEDVADPGIQTSMHELNLRSVFEFLPDRVQPEIMVLGVEPEVIDYGLDLSPSVGAALPELLEATREIVGRWQGQDFRGERRVCQGL
jgi:hydrogenase maturation protease